MPLTVEIILVTILFVWLAGLTFFVWQLSGHYNRLTAGTTGASLRTILENLLREVGLMKKEVVQLNMRCDTLSTDGLLHIQKVGLMRFNPFNDTGGNQSFILSMVDAEANGVVISALYSRSGTRWYAKQVIHGKGVEHELSDEEKKALKEATKAQRS